MRRTVAQTLVSAASRLFSTLAPNRTRPPYPLTTLQLPACNLPVAPAGEPADQNSDTIPQGSPNRALLFATTPIISFCKPAQWR